MHAMKKSKAKTVLKLTVHSQLMLRRLFYIVSWKITLFCGVFEKKALKNILSMGL